MDRETFDLIIVGAGNGACGFLSRYLDDQPTERILVIEAGDNFFFSSDIAHQYNWLKSFSEGKIFKLHHALTPNNIPILSGYANTMGGGGSINYTMMHESSRWLTEHLGYSVEYWNDLKQGLNPRFERPNPADDLSEMANFVLQQAQEHGFQLAHDAIANIPNQPDADIDALHLFPSLFNPFGQRTHSGVSIVDWTYPTLTLKTKHRVDALILESDAHHSQRCTAIQVQDLNTQTCQTVHLAPTGRLILCAGAASPRLLMPHQHHLGRGAIGQQVSDHILLPLGLYFAKKPTTPKDNYIPIFATSLWQPKPEPTDTPSSPTLCTFDFFAGQLERLLYLVSHLFLALLLPNCIKRYVFKWPCLFTLTKRIVRLFVWLIDRGVGIVSTLLNALQGRPLNQRLELVTAIIKFQPATAGHYEPHKRQITLDFFAEHDGFIQDQVVAETLIQQHIDFLNSLGQQPPKWLRFLLRLLFQLPYEAQQVPRYVRAYRKNYLLTEQHLAGGCLSGQTLDTGVSDPQRTGLVHGASNIHVADLSSVPLPRCSPQMTAYLIGFHVAHRLSGGDYKPWDASCRPQKSIFH